MQIHTNADVDALRYCYKASLECGGYRKQNGGNWTRLLLWETDEIGEFWMNSQELPTIDSPIIMRTLTGPLPNVS